MKSVALALVLCALSAVAAAQGGGKGGQGQGGGQARQRAGDADCGRELVVVKPDGTRQRFDSVGAFLDAFPTVEIDQGEQPRRAVRVDDLLREYGADWLDALDCQDKSVQLPGGLPVRTKDYLVLTGRSTLKGVREVGPRRYANTIQSVRKLTFHGASAKGAAPLKKP